MFYRRGEVTDEYLVETQPNNATVPPSQSIVMQPISNNAHIHKTKYYENDVSKAPTPTLSRILIFAISSRSAQFDNNLITPGKYRQRSYDNLKMGKCSSDVNRAVQKQSPSSLSKYRLSADLSKINNEEQTNHRRKSCAIASHRDTPSIRLNRPISDGSDRNVKLTRTHTLQSLWTAEKIQLEKYDRRAQFHVRIRRRCRSTKCSE